MISFSICVNDIYVRNVVVDVTLEKWNSISKDDQMALVADCYVEIPWSYEIDSEETALLMEQME